MAEVKEVIEPCPLCGALPVDWATDPRVGIDELMGALKPFLDHFSWFEDRPEYSPDDSIDEGTAITVGDMRAARALSDKGAK